jgi:hypothetical protein
MKRRIIAILVVVPLPFLVIAYSLIMSSVAGVLSISTDKPVFQQGERITFMVRNNGLESLEFPDPGLGFRIKNLDTGEYVRLGWGYPQVIHRIFPLTGETIEWDQTETSRESVFERVQVKPGNYVATVGTARGFAPEGAAAIQFRIS